VHGDAAARQLPLACISLPPCRQLQMRACTTAQVPDSLTVLWCLATAVQLPQWLRGWLLGRGELQPRHLPRAHVQVHRRCAAPPSCLCCCPRCGCTSWHRF